MPLTIADSPTDERRNRGLGFSWNQTEDQVWDGGDKNFIWDVKECCTCREGELNLLIDDFHGDEVVFLIETAVVE